jgi:hypothetical protein
MSCQVSETYWRVPTDGRAINGITVELNLPKLNVEVVHASAMNDRLLMGQLADSCGIRMFSKGWFHQKTITQHRDERTDTAEVGGDSRLERLGSGSRIRK